MPVGLGDGDAAIEFRRLGHLLELVGLGLVELLHPLGGGGDPSDGQVLLRDVDHPVHLVLIGHQKDQVVLVGSVFLHATLVLEELEDEVGRRRGIGALDSGGVVVEDHELGELGVIIHVGGLGRKVDGLQDAFAPDLLDTLIEFRLSLDLADRAHLVVDDLAEGRLGLEAIPQAVVVEEPALVDQALEGLVYQRGIVAGLEHGQSQVGGIDT